MDKYTESLRQRVSYVLELPRELQDAIVAHLDYHIPGSGQREHCYFADRTLLDLSYTCKALRVVCLPTIYKDIEISVDRSPGRLNALLRALSSSSRPGRYIKTLTIRNFDPADEIAEKLLEYTPRLVSVYFEYWILDEHEDRDPLPIDTKLLSGALGYVSGSLKDLYIGYKLSGGYYRPDPRSVPSILHNPCSFKHLVLVEHLIIPLEVLVGWNVEQAPSLVEILPPSLVSLHLERGAQHRFLNPSEHDPLHLVLKPFVEGGKWRNHTPNLKRVSGDIRVWTTYRVENIFSEIPELHKRSTAVKKLLHDNELEYPEDVYRLLKLNGLVPPGPRSPSKWGDIGFE